MPRQDRGGGQPGGWRQAIDPRTALAPRVALPLVAGALITLGSGAVRAQMGPCIDCHEVDEDAWASSVHGVLECVDCHLDAEEENHPDDVAPIDCALCHEEEVEAFAASVHAEQFSAENELGHICSTCHGSIHELVSQDEPSSPVHRLQLAGTCGSCHANPEMAERYEFHMVQPLEAYTASVHARALEVGFEAATCSSCHGSHGILPAADPRSRVNHWRVAATCSECHAEIGEEYISSVHGMASEHGIQEAPVCTDCHGEHRILEPRHRDSPVYATNVPKMTCGRCHSDLRLSDKFGLALDKAPAYEDSFHGLAARAGSITVANCSSCHGVHDIHPSSDPKAHTHPANLGATCGQCHPGAGTRFAIGPVHIDPTEPEHAAVFWIRRLYLWIIFLTVGAMVLHNALDLYRKARHPFPGSVQMGERGPERMSLGFRLVHGLFALSFLVLVYTGFALKYPEAWWAAPILQWESTFGLRGWLHRIAGIAMLIAVALHLGHLAASRPARRCIGGMWPTGEDWQEFKERLGFLLGRRADPPVASWLGYPEKVEYLALVWGTVIMVVTGFVLWFDDFFLRWMPKWVMDVATVIHFYEAVLASLAILVWHFYFVIFDPVVYPMDPSWLTGRSAAGRDLERKGADSVFGGEAR